MTTTSLDPSLRSSLSGKTVIITGAANGIGAETARTFHSHGANVVIADLSFAKDAAHALISSLPDPSEAIFVPTNVLDWKDMLNLFGTAIEKYGKVDIVVANAGLMESKPFFEMEIDESGDLKESVEANRVIDVNLKGTMNTLRLGMHYLRSNPVDPSTSSRGSIVLVSSTSGYFGGTGVVSYIASKHGVIGLLRSSQKVASQNQVRVNAVAPFFTPTHITGGYAEKWYERGLPANKVTDVAVGIVQTASDPNMTGRCCLVAGRQMKEIEQRLAKMTPDWVGDDMYKIMTDAGKFFDEMGGYPLPQPRR